MNKVRPIFYSARLLLAALLVVALVRLQLEAAILHHQRPPTAGVSGDQLNGINLNRPRQQPVRAERRLPAEQQQQQQQQQPLLLPEEQRQQTGGGDVLQQQLAASSAQPSTRFLILSTGDQLKLYPFEGHSSVAGQASVNLSASYFELKSTLEVEPSAWLQLAGSKRLANSTFARHLAQRQLMLSSRSSPSSPSTLSPSSSSLPSTPPSPSSNSQPRRAGQARSILPARYGAYDDDDDHSRSSSSSSNDEPGQSGWRPPWITDVDYFFQPEFCPRSASQERPASARDCLVVVWLDKSNRYVRFGSLDLTKVNLDSPALVSSSAGKSRRPVLLLREFAPIELFRRPELRLSGREGQVSSMVVDRRRAMLHVALSDGSQPTPNRILTGKFRVPEAAGGASGATGDSESENEAQQLAGERLLSFNQCPGRKAADLEGASFENLNVDEANGNWLFYFDKQGGGKIFGLSVKQRAAGAGRLQEAFAGAATQALVRDIGALPANLLEDGDGGNDDDEYAAARWPPIGQTGNNEVADSNSKDEVVGTNSGSGGGVSVDLSGKQAPRKPQGGVGMALDPSQRLIYWLNEANELFSCNYAGLEAKLVGRLSARPAIRDPSTMQVFQGTLYISDPIKKSLIAYALPGALQAKATIVTSSSSSWSRNGTSSEIQRRRNISEQPEIRATHQVLLVEMPTLYGFRFVDAEALEASELARTAGCIGGEEGESSLCLSLSEPQVTNLAKELTGDSRDDKSENENEIGKEKEDEDKSSGLEVADSYTVVANQYEKLLLCRLSYSGSSSQCGYEQSDYERRMSAKHGRMISFIWLELSILSLAFLSVCFCYPRLKAKLRELHNNGCNHSNAARNRSNSKTEFCKDPVQVWLDG